MFEEDFFLFSLTLRFVVVFLFLLDMLASKCAARAGPLSSFGGCENSHFIIIFIFFAWAKKKLSVSIPPTSPCSHAAHNKNLMTNFPPSKTFHNFCFFFPYTQRQNASHTPYTRNKLRHLGLGLYYTKLLIYVYGYLYGNFTRGDVILERRPPPFCHSHPPNTFFFFFFNIGPLAEEENNGSKKKNLDGVYISVKILCGVCVCVKKHEGGRIDF